MSRESQNKSQQNINNVLNFKRNHPLRKDWDDWQTIVRIFHNPQTKQLQKAINKGWRNYNVYDFDNRRSYLIDEIYYLTQMYEQDFKLIKDKDNYYEFAYQMFKKGEIFSNAWIPIDNINFGCDDCTRQYVDLFNCDCVMKNEHLKAHILAYMWAFYLTKTKRERKRIRKYYEKLELVVLSLPYDRLKYIDFDCIFKPQKYVHFKNSLLVSLYERFHLDGWTNKNLKDLPYIFEYLKNIRLPKSQGPEVANQSFSGDRILTSECLEELYNFVKDKDFDVIYNKFIPKSQGMFGMEHNLELSDSSVSKLKDMLNESQNNFIEGMKESLISAGTQLSVMFIIAATVSLLSRIVASIGVTIVMKMLHTLYLFIMDRTCADEVKKSVAVSQSGDIVSIPFIPSMILKYIVSPPQDILNKIWKSSTIDLVMRRIGYLGDIKIERGVEKVVEWVKEVIRKLQQWYGQDVLGLSCGIYGFYSNEESPLLTWYKDVDDICNKYFKDEFRWTELEFQVIYNHYKQGLSLVRNAEFIKYKNDIYRILRQLTTIMEKFKAKGITNQNIRNPPVTIYLYGGTGVGKSSITYPLAVEILKNIHEREGSTVDLKKEWKNMIYMRAPEQEYWDGYENQLVTVFDDFCQQTDSLQNPNVELFEIIRSSNCFPYPLHMASIEQKANTTFTSKIIIVSSNLQSPQCASLNFPEALRRRFDICVQVNREFKGHTNAFDPSAYNLDKFDMMTGIKQCSYDYKSLVSDCVDAYFGRKNFVNTIENYIDSILEAGIDTVDLEVPRSQGGNFDFVNDDEFQDAIDDQEHLVNRPSTSQVVKQIQESEVDIFVQRRIKELIKEEAKKIGVTPGLLEANIKCGNNGLAGQSFFTKVMKEYEWEQKNKDPFHLLAYYIHESYTVSSKYLQKHWISFKTKHSYLSKALMAFSFIAIGLSFVKIFSTFKSILPAKEVAKRSSRAVLKSVEEIVKSESYTAVKTAVPKVESYTPTAVKVAKVESYTPIATKVAKIESIASSEGVKDINATEILMKVVRTNLYKMSESTRGTVIGHVMFLKGKVAVMPKHFLSAFYQSLRNDAEAYVYFENCFLERTFSIKIKDLMLTKKEYESPDESEGPILSRDLMCFSVKTSIYHSDATNYFVSKSSMSRVESSEVMLPILMTNTHKESNKACLLIRYAKGHSQLECVERLPVADEADVVARYIRNAYMYNLDTQETECGAPLIVRNSLIQPGKICGLHIAGITGTGQGWSTCVYKEDIIKILSLYEEKDVINVDIKLPLSDFPQQQCRIPESAQFIHIGKFSRKICQPSTSQIVPSPLYSKIKEPVTRPCLLHKRKDGFDPRTYRLERLGNETVCLDEDMIKFSSEAFLDEVSTVFERNKDCITENCKAVYSFEEACVGIDGEPYINSVKRDTSSGFPFVCMNGFTRKDIFGTKENYSLDSDACQVIKKRVNNIIENAKNNVCLDHIFIDTLKDERKLIEKSHKTRLFSAGPIDYLIACKMYFNGVVNLLSKNRNNCHVSVGTNVYSKDWHNIVQQLHNKSKCMIAGDFEGFDASQHQRLLEASLEVLIQLSIRFLKATEEDVRVMRVLSVSLVNSLHIMDDLVYQWTHSLPSGHYLTAIINSVFVNLAFGCIWQIYKKKFSYRTARMFWNRNGIVAYGDDHIVAVPLSEIDGFNQFTIPKFMSKIGLSYTMEDKDASVEKKYRFIDEINYLKRGFKFDKTLNRYICPLNLDTILEFPMWNHKCPDPIAQTIVELEKCIEELSLHDNDVWNKYILKLHECGRSLGHYSDKLDQEETKLVALGQDSII